MAYNSSHTGAQHDGYVTKTELINLIYPVGSIYMSLTNTSPATLFGGTWTAIAEGTFMMAAGSTYASGSTGGTRDHYHATNAHTLTTNEMPAHNHGGIFYLNGDANFPMIAYPGWDGPVSGYRSLRTNDTTSGGGYDIVPPTNGGGAAHDHGNTSSSLSLPPYMAVYMWKRTA